MSFIKATIDFIKFLLLTVILTGVGLTGFAVNDGNAQHGSSLYHWQHEVYGHHTASMSMANAALSQFANPAVGGRMNHVGLRSNLGSASVFSFDFEETGYSPTLTNFGLAFTQQRYWLSLSADDFNYNLFNTGPNRLQSLKLHAGYQLNRTLAVGLGMGVNRWSLPEIVDHSGYGGRPDQTRANTSFDAGVYYSDSFSKDQFILRPVAGLSVNNIGSKFEMETGIWPGTYYLPQAGQLRWSLGAQAETRSEWRGRSWLGAGLYTGLIKYFSRIPETAEDRSHGFTDLFTNWGSFEKWGWPRETISTFDQIALGLGAELQILEVLSFRYGGLSGADYWIRSRQSWGVGIDLNYVSFNITGINYKSEAGWDDKSRLIFYELEVNIPVSVFNFLRPL